MANFIITGPDGKKYKVSGADQAGALDALKKMLGTTATASPVTQNQEPQGYESRLAAMRARQPAAGSPESVARSDRQAEMDAGAEQAIIRETSRSANVGAGISPLRSAVLGVGQGATFGLSDEITARLAAIGPTTYDQELAKTRGLLDASREVNPKSNLVGEVGGALAMPAGAVKSGISLAGKAVRGAVSGAASGFAYGFGTGEGDALKRAASGREAAAYGAVIGGIAPVVLTGAAKSLRRIFAVSEARPAVETLRAAKTAAYRAVEAAGDTFQPPEIAGLWQSIAKKLDDADYVGGFGQQADIQLARIKKMADRNIPVTLSRLDDVRSRLWKAYSAASDETEILDMIGSIDDMIESRAGTSELMSAARLANSRFKKAEMLDAAFTHASNQVAGTGSGGNILNKYKQAVTSIIDNPKRAKWFSAPELQAMQGFVRGDFSESVMRKIGKLAPGGNGLMTALNLGAVSVNPAMLGVTALSSGAKAISDGSVTRRAEDLISMVATGRAPKKAESTIRGSGRISGLLGNSLAN